MLLLLLAVCGNTANLMLARASARQREMGMRLALGAGPWRIVRLLLTENLMLALIGAALGVAIAVWGTRALARDAADHRLPGQLRDARRRRRPRCSPSRWASCAARSSARRRPCSWRVSIRSSRSAPASAPGGRSRLRNALMAVQVALALVVLVAAGLFLRSFLETRDTDPGFRRDGVLLAAYDLTGRNADERARA